MEWWKAAGIVLVAVLVMFNIAATVALARSTLLDPFQKWAQGAIVWLIPLLGAFFIVHIVSDHEPEAVPRRALAWSGVGWCLLLAAGREFGSDAASTVDGGVGFGDFGGGGGDGGGAGGGP